MKQKLNLLLRCNESVVHDDVSLLLLFELEESVHRLHLPQILEKELLNHQFYGQVFNVVIGLEESLLVYCGL